MDVSLGDISKPQDLTKGKELFEQYLHPEKILDTELNKQTGGWWETIKSLGETLWKVFDITDIESKKQREAYQKQIEYASNNATKDLYDFTLAKFNDTDKDRFNLLIDYYKQKPRVNNIEENNIELQKAISKAEKSMYGIKGYGNEPIYQYEGFGKKDKLKPEELTAYLENSTKDVIKTQEQADEFEKWYNYNKLSYNAEGLINFVTKKVSAGEKFDEYISL